MEIYAREPKKKSTFFVNKSFWGNVGFVDDDNDDYIVILIRPYWPNTLLCTFFRFEYHVIPFMNSIAELSN